MELAYEHKTDILAGLDKILTAKYLWDKKGIRLNEQLNFYENNTEIFSNEFWEIIIKITLESDKISSFENEDRYEFNFLFNWPVWERISKLQGVLNEIEHICLISILKESEHIYSDMSDIRLVYCMDGMVCLSVSEYQAAFSHLMIKSIIDIALAFNLFAESVHNRLNTKNLVQGL